MNNDSVDIFHNFFQKNKHLLDLDDYNWPTDRLLFQLGYETLESSIATQAEAFYSKGRVDWEWMKCLFRTYKEYQSFDISDHLKSLTQIRSYNDKIISSSKDGHICIWNSTKITNPISIISVFSQKFQKQELEDKLREARLSKASSSEIEYIQRQISDQKLMMREELLDFIFIDENNLIAWSNDVNLFLIDINTSSSKILSGHSDSIIGVEKISRHSILSWSFDNTLRLWDLSSGDSKVLKGHTDWINGLKVLNDEKVISYSKDNTLRLWDLSSGDSKVLKGHTDWINGLKVLNDEKVISYSKDNTLRLWDLSSGDSKVLKGHTDWINGFKVLNDEKVISYSKDNTLRLWDLAGGDSRVLEGHTDSVLGLEFLDKNKIISWSEDNSLKIWNLKTLEYYNLGNHNNIIKGVRLTGRTSVLSWSWDKSICLWDTNTISLITKYIFPGVDKLIINDDLFFCIGMNGSTRMLKKTRDN